MTNSPTHLWSRPKPPEPGHLWGVVALTSVLAGIQLIAQLVPVAKDLAPSEIAQALWRDRALLVTHTSATVLEATLGLAVAWWLSLSIGTPLLPGLARAAGRHAVALVNALPLVAVVPLLALLLDRSWLAVVFAALAGIPAVWPVVDQWLSAADRVVDSSPLALYAPTGWRRVRLLGMAALFGPLPQVLRAGVPLCVFGATLAGFVNSERGLGVYLAVAMWQGDAAKVLAGAFVTTGICAFAYSMAGTLERIRPGDMRVALERDQNAPARGTRQYLRQVTGTFATAIGLWIAIGWAAQNPVFFKYPHELLDRSVYEAGTQNMILRAATQTILWSAAGLAVGFVAACGLVGAVAFEKRSRWVALPIVFVSQTIPLTVLVSIIVVFCGRGFATAMVFATSVSFLTSFLIMEGGLIRLWSRYGDLCDVFGRRRFRFATRVLWPGSREYVIRALAVSAPRAVLGVVLAEYLVLRTGVGGIMYEARGRMEVHLLWLMIVLVAAVGLLCQVVFPFWHSPGRVDSAKVV